MNNVKSFSWSLVKTKAAHVTNTITIEYIFTTIFLARWISQMDVPGRSSLVITDTEKPLCAVNNQILELQERKEGMELQEIACVESMMYIGGVICAKVLCRNKNDRGVSTMSVSWNLRRRDAIRTCQKDRNVNNCEPSMELRSVSLIDFLYPWLRERQA